MNTPREPIRSAQNRQIQQLRKWLAHPAGLRKDGVFLADGYHLVSEALVKDYPIENLFVETDRNHPELEELLSIAEERAAPVTWVSSRIFRSISPVESPQGVLGVFRRKAASLVPPEGNVVVADGIQDPRNLGSICRSARAAGAAGLWVLPGTVDAFHPQTLRSAMGATFDWPVQMVPNLSDEPPVPSNRTWIALSNHGTEELTGLDPNKDYALVLGAEGGGLRDETIHHIDRQIRIPMSRDVESLGVAAAAAVALFWLQFRRAEANP